MSGWRAVEVKQRREFRRRNHVAKDLYTPKYGPKIRESKKHHLIDELHEEECLEAVHDYVEEQDDSDYWFFKGLGLSTKE